MSNTHSTLDSLFGDIADAIRGKDGTSADIKADNFPSRITAIPSGSSEMKLLGTSAVSTLDTFMRANPIEMETDKHFLVLEVRGTNIQTSGSVTLIKWVFPLRNNALMYNSSNAPISAAFYSSGAVAPDSATTFATSSRTDACYIEDGYFKWRTGTSYYIGIGNSVYYGFI